jgi:hypothetical protein
MMHGLLHDSAILGTIGHAKHMTHHKGHGTRHSQSVFGCFVQLAQDSQKAKARKARTRKGK